MDIWELKQESCLSGLPSPISELGNQEAWTHVHSFQSNNEKTQAGKITDFHLQCSEIKHTIQFIEFFIEPSANCEEDKEKIPSAIKG